MEKKKPKQKDMTMIDNLPDIHTLGPPKQEPPSKPKGRLRPRS